MATAELDTITVKGFKSIASIEKLKLGAINVVIGPNGSGKSNFIGVFSFLHAIREGRLQDYVATAGGAEKIQRDDTITRRVFLTLIALAPVLVSASCRQTAVQRGSRHTRTPQVMFVSQGKTAILNVDGSGLRCLDFNVPNQVTWQPAGAFSDGRRVLILSMETRRDGPGRPFDEYYTQTPTHLWIYDLKRATLEEIATKERLAVFYTPQLLLSDERMLVQVVRGKAGQIFSMNLDGTDAREFTRAGEGLPYGLSLSPNGQRVAFHLASPRGYQVWTSDTDGRNRALVAAHPDHLYFGTSWSPDGQWILYQDCHFKEDPAHDGSDICIGRAEGSEHRVLTHGQAQWFGAAYGHPKNRGSGSNMPSWTGDGQILFSQKLPGAKVAWEFQAKRVDVDHFNRDWKPELAHGGTEICRLNPSDGGITPLTHSDPPVWDFRASESPDRTHIVFCRAQTGGVPALWAMKSDGAQQRLLTRGLGGAGADHPRWLPPTN